jgi:mannose-6-phosphate isomerase
MQPYPIKFHPIFKEKVWGGRRLEELLEKDLPADKPIGESWEVSTVGGSESVIANGPLAGIKLNEALRRHSKTILGQLAGKYPQGEFPLLVKFVDAHDDLSVQVHPGGEDLKKPALRGGREKNEGWFVIYADRGARLVAGISGDLTKTGLERIAKTPEIEKALKYLPVKTGDAVFLKTGTVHAIGRGILLYEIQQPSDTTYRVWDYNRPGLDGKPRATHLKEALECIRFGARMPRKLRGRIMGRKPERIRYFDNIHFSLEMMSARGVFEWPYKSGFPRTATVLAGGMTLRGGFGEVRAGAGETVLIPADLKSLELKARVPLLVLVARPK